jgi:hypothetical protein
MITLLGTLLGFFSSAVPHIFSMYQDRQDRMHELKILDLQLKQLELNHGHKLQEIEVKAVVEDSKSVRGHAGNQKSGYKWVDALRASVRPIITYAFFLVFVVVKMAALIKAIEMGEAPIDTIIAIWDIETHALFAAVMAFWFGGRTFSKIRNGM